MSDDTKAPDFGCAHCWPESAEAAWEASRGFATRAELIDESHFHVTIRACGACGQAFVSVFTEMIDWTDGEDPQYWSLLPLTEAEATELIRRGAEVTERELNATGPGRRCLRRDYPKGEPPRIDWGAGLRVGPHD